MLVSHLVRNFLVLVICNIKISSATCESQQKEECLEAASTNRMTILKSAGRCSQKNYLKFTHVCLVNNYTPEINHCCCLQQDEVVMCCPYRQTWNHFRCTETFDTIGNLNHNSPVSHDVTFIFCVVIGCLFGGIIVSYLILLLRKRLLKGHWCSGNDVIMTPRHERTRDHDLPSQFPRTNTPSGCHRHPRTTSGGKLHYHPSPPSKSLPSTNQSSSSSSSLDHRAEDMASSSSAKNLISPKRMETRYNSMDDARVDKVDFVIVDCRDQSTTTQVWQKAHKVKVVKLTRFHDGSSLL